MDVDGVLTDGGMYYFENGDEAKKFNTRDGMGISMVRKAGIITAVITAESTEIVRRRCKKLNIDEVYQGVKDKLSVIKELCKKYGIDKGEVVYIGDDVNDLEVIKYVDFSFTVADGMEIVKNSAKYITRLKGGEGAVREVCEFILKELKLQ